MNSPEIAIEEATQSSPATQQVQWGWAPPQSPGGTQRVNVFDYVEGKDTMGTGTFSKPVGYGSVRIEHWIKVSEIIPPGEFLEVQILIAEFENDGPPQEFIGRAFLFDSTNIDNKIFKRLVTTFRHLDDSSGRAYTLYVVRKNSSIFTPMATGVELWSLRHAFAFKPE